MLLAELKIKVRGEFEDYENNEDKFDDAFTKLVSYAQQLFGEDWAKNLKVEIED